MPFDWLEFYRLAKQLSRQTTDEAAMRCAISRAYYSVYHLANERRKRNSIPLPLVVNAGIHLRLWYLFRTHADSTCRKIGFEGDRLRRSRTAADYQPTIRNLQFELSLAMSDAQKLISSINDLAPNLP
jgi:hypothetical protein